MSVVVYSQILKVKVDIFQYNETLGGLCIITVYIGLCTTET